MIIKEELYIIKERDYPYVNLKLRSNDIVYVTFKDECEITVELQEQLLLYYKAITNGK